MCLFKYDDEPGQKVKLKARLTAHGHGPGGILVQKMEPKWLVLVLRGAKTTIKMYDGHFNSVA